MGVGLMDAILYVLKILEEYGRWRAEILNIYGLEGRESAKLSEEIWDRLKRLSGGNEIVLRRGLC
jgi:hypothetical protein